MLNKLLSRRSFLALSAATAAAFALDKRALASAAAGLGPKGGFPVVIIGAGLGGLCCGAYLAREGFPVKIIEQRNIPGGYACSFERAGGRYCFDVSLHGMSAKNNAAARILEDLGVLSKLEFVELPEVYHLKTEDFAVSIPQHDPDKYIRSLAARFPTEEEGIRRLIYEIIAIAEEGDKLHRKGMCSKLFFPFKYPKLYNVLDKTLDDFMGEYVNGSTLKNILGSLWDFHGLPPSKLSALYYAIAKGDVLKNGTYYIKQRCRDLSYALARVVEEAGGEILYDTMAERVLIRDGTVTAVKDSDGKVHPAKIVVSNASVPSTFMKIFPQEAIPPGYLKDLKSYRPSLSTFIVWLGLNQEIKDRLPVSGIQVISKQGPEKEYQASLHGDVDKIPFRISVYDNMYENYSKPGTSTLRILCLSGYEPWRRFETDYRDGKKNNYYREKHRWAQSLIRRAEEVVPGLSSMIEIQEAATPLTNWRFTRNTQGAIYGFEQSVDNAYVKRVNNTTPIKGLYLAGAWCNPGGGFGGVLLSGQLAFRDIMEGLSG